MFTLLVAGFLGFALNGWVGLAIGACVGAVAAALADELTPAMEHGTVHELRMRADRRYRRRYESLEDGWRRPYRRPASTAWRPVAEAAMAVGGIVEPEFWDAWDAEDAEAPASIDARVAVRRPSAGRRRKAS